MGTYIYEIVTVSLMAFDGSSSKERILVSLFNCTETFKGELKVTDLRVHLNSRSSQCPLTNSVIFMQHFVELCIR